MRHNKAVLESIRQLQDALEVNNIKSAFSVSNLFNNATLEVGPGITGIAVLDKEDLLLIANHPNFLCTKPSHERNQLSFMFDTK